MALLLQAVVSIAMYSGQRNKMLTTYANLKALVTQKNLTWQYLDAGDYYNVFAVDTGVMYSATIYKSPLTVGGLDAVAEQANQTDFETNIEPLCNFAIGSRPYAFATPDFLFNASGIVATATHGTSTNIDFKVPGTLGEFQYLNGAYAFTQNANFGDYVNVYVVDKDNILGYGANTVLANYINHWYIDPSHELDITTPYAAKAPSGVYIRVEYVSTSTSVDVGIAVNFMLHTPI